MSRNSKDPHPALGERRSRRPRLREHTLRRPRLDERFAALLSDFEILHVVAGAGFGKTLQTLSYAETAGHAHVAWLTLDERNRSASNLLTGLAAALSDDRTGSRAPAAIPDLLRDARRSDLADSETAALLAAAIDGEDWLIVLDEMEFLDDADSSRAVLDTFLEHLSEEVRVILLSRTELGWPLQRHQVEGRLVTLPPDELLMTVEDAASLLREHGHDPTGAAHVHGLSGGWPVAIAMSARYGIPEFETMKNLSAYIDHHVLGGIPDDEQQFLMTVAVVGVLTLDAAIAVCGMDAHRLWAKAASYHLPGLWVSEHEMECRSLLRNHLVERLLRTRPEEKARILTAYAEHLTASGQHMDATALWLDLGARDRAAGTAADAVEEIGEHGDWATVLGWLSELGESRILANPRLIGGWIRALHGDRRFDETERLVVRLDRDGVLGPVLAEQPALLATTALALQGNRELAFGLLERFSGDHRAAAVRFMLDAIRSEDPAVPPYGDSWDDAERAFAWGLLLQGKVADVAALLPADPDAPLMDPTLVLALVFRDDWATASEAWSRIPTKIRHRPHARFVEAMLNVIGHRYDLAEGLLLRAISDSHRTGFTLKTAYEVMAGYVLLARGEDSRARELLLTVVATTSKNGQLAYLEWAQCMLGIVELRRGQAHVAVLLLEKASQSMHRSQRLLLVPLAAVALAEGKFRVGDPEGSYESAELAYRVASDLGNFAVLNWGLHQFEDVRVRAMQRDRTDTKWRQLLVASTRPTHPVPHRHENVETVLYVQPFGRDRDLFINGVARGIGRIKLLELVACVARHPDGIDRHHLQSLLFPDASPQNGANHFRQITHRLRQETGVALDREGNLLRLGDDVHVVTGDGEFERILASASGRPFEERMELLTSALATVSGQYLEGSHLTWVDERRRHLDLIREEAQIALATLFVKAGRPAEARDVCEDVLERNPYSDPAYRVRVAVERRYGSESSLMTVYARAQAALSELGLAPGDARRLLEEPLTTPGLD